MILSILMKIRIVKSKREIKVTYIVLNLQYFKKQSFLLSLYFVSSSVSRAVDLRLSALKFSKGDCTHVVYSKDGG